MSLFRNTFEHRHTFLPVIHAESEKQAVRNAQIAFDGGADGVFLINHTIDASALLQCSDAVLNELPDLWVGLNFLGATNSNALEWIPRRVSGLWTDNAGINPNGKNPVLEAQNFERERAERARSWPGIYFGGVAFKHQLHVQDPGLAACLAIPYVDVVTTSGPATGKAPNILKIRAMKQAIGNHPLAIASGMTPDNVRQFMPWADCFLVATGISESQTELDPGKMRQFAKIIGQ